MAGRSRAKALALIDTVECLKGARLLPLELDVRHEGLSSLLQELKVGVVVHTSSPFQGQDYSVARACIESGCYYFDLADGREFVEELRCLDSEAVKAGVAVLSRNR